MTKVGLHCLPDALEDAKRLGVLLGTVVHDIKLHRFPDGESRVTVAPPAETTIIYGSLSQPNEKLITLLLAVEALRRNGAQRIVLVAPYLCYMRQDAAFLSGEAISQKAIGGFLSSLVDRIVTVDAHLHRTANLRDAFPEIEADNLAATPAIAAALRNAEFDPLTVVAGPDAESHPWVAGLAQQLSVAHTVAKKVRRGDRSVEIAFDEGAIIKDRPILLLDDMASSGSTLAVAARALRASGARTIDVIVTHALFPDEAMVALAAAGIRSVRSTTSVPHATNAIRLDRTLADALREEFSGPDYAEPSP